MNEANEKSTAANCSTDITFEDVQKAMDGSRALQPNDAPDVYVMTTTAFLLVRDQLSEEHSPIQPFSRFAMSSMIGVHIEHYETLREVHERCVELRDTGKSVAMICQ